MDEINQINNDIEELELTIFTYENHLKFMRERLERLKERKKSIELYNQK